MDTETPYMKWTAAAIGFVIVCFCIGFFVLGPKGNTQTITAPGASGARATKNTITLPKTTPPPNLTVSETTTEREAQALRMKQLESENATLQAEVKRLQEEVADKEREVAEARRSARRVRESEPVAPPRDNAPPREPETPTEEAPNSDGLYRVRVGSFESREEAESTANEMQSKNYAAQVRRDRRGRYYIQNGAFNKANAEERLQELRNNGFDADVVGP